MKITLLCTGKTDFSYISSGMQIYEERLRHYVKFSVVYIPALKNVSSLTEEQIKEKEGLLILKEIGTGKNGAAKRAGNAWVVLLDERGMSFDSVGWARHLEQKFLSGGTDKEIFFVVGGAYGFSEDVYARANEKISLSQMTFSHQMVRLIFIEQLYRAFTIMKGEPYHHQ
ncbi:MAG: 23S rRNA (pseudouridine(1915)-N(3))-methyltransferase RlmH [Bacteroidales bacterium]|nr:23S rRNA (pseudouridine(1915)-N(3))-methyltransferase RlmH [Bacteroidales bacterium]